MNLVERAGLIIAAIVSTGALFVALGQIWKGLKTVWRTFGWRGAFWRWLVRGFRAVDIITSIPERLALLEQRGAAHGILLAEHIEQSRPQVDLLNTMARDLGLLVPIAKDVHHEVKHNSGSSMKDALARVEQGVQGLYSPAGTGPVTVILPKEHP